MCGLAGIVRRGTKPVDPLSLARMAGALRHRGPDGYGFLLDRRVGLAHVRLSIVDVGGGAQPMANEDENLVIVYNGEVYNHLELRHDLLAAGHRFRTRCDTEALIHGYEQWGGDLFNRLNGQFAFALVDRRSETVVLARDRFGVRPLFYAETKDGLVFASEAKALFASGEVEAAPDPEGIDEAFTLWGARAPRTPFRGVRQLPPGCFAIWRAGRLETHRFVELRYHEPARESKDTLERLDHLIRDSVRLRMRSDVPVGGYLSGGLDSSICCAVAADQSPYPVRTFSIAFSNPEFDESVHQQLVARAIGSQHTVCTIGPSEIAASFPEVIRHTESPVVRTAPAPMYWLSRLARERGIKVVLTGEGSDELFLGYDLFKETMVRWFCGRQPSSTRRPLLFDRLYPYLRPGAAAGDFWRRSFLDFGSPNDPLFSHLPRFAAGAATRAFYSGAVRDALAGTDPLARLRDELPPAFGDWSVLNKAAFLETTTLLSGYLLSSQGDRMALAHGVEGRFPFLDHRLFDFAASLPTRSKLRGLREKDVLRRWARGVIPDAVLDRPKQPYRAPDAAAFFGPEQPEYVDELLSEAAIRKAGYFDPLAVAGLVRRCRAGRAMGIRENQALVSILSTQLWHKTFIGDTYHSPGLPWETADVRLIGVQQTQEASV